MQFVALRPILFGGRQYSLGDVISCDDGSLASIWLENGAVQRGDSSVPQPESESTDTQDVSEETPSNTPPQPESESSVQLGRSRRREKKDTGS